MKVFKTEATELFIRQKKNPKFDKRHNFAVAFSEIPKEEIISNLESTILPADKGNTTIIMNKEDYNNRIMGY